MTDAIKSIKAFNSDLTCLGFQYEIGGTYEIDGEAKICSNGFHACDGSPFDLWKFYPVVDENGAFTRYADVLQDGSIDRKNGAETSKLASTKITIDAEITFPQFISRAIEWIVGACKSSPNNSSGNYAKIGSIGYSARIGSSGDSAQIGSSGNYAKIKVNGKNSVVSTCGIESHVSGVDGTWVSVAEFGDDGICIGFATGCIGKDGLKDGVMYRAKGGKLVEA